jgi:putative membrane protein
MKKLTYLLLGVTCLFVVSSCQDNVHSKNYNDLTLVDYDGIRFIQNGIEGGLTEIKAAQLAKTNSTNQQVVSFANMMITDHKDVGAHLKKIRKDKLVDTQDRISVEHQHMIAALSLKKGAEFDKAYMQMMVQDHEHAISLFIDGSSNTSSEIKNFAEETLPTLHKHLESARSIYTHL